MISTGIIRLTWSNLAAQSAEQVSLAAIPIVAAVSLGAGAEATGVLSAVQTFPFLLLSMPAGMLADRMARKRLMAAAELIRGIALAALVAMAVTGALTLPLLGALGCLAAMGTVAYSVAAPALVPALVPRAELARANSRLELARSMAFSAGPVLGGALVAWTSSSAAFACAAALSLTACLLLMGLPEPPRQMAARRSLWADLKEGAAFTARQPLLRAILLTAVAWNVSWFIMQAVFVLYALQKLGMSAAGVGAALGMCGAGMVTGAALASRIARHVRFGALVTVGPVVSLLAALVLAASVQWPTPALAFIAMFLFGAGPILWTIAQTTLRQAITPAVLLGRVSALMMMATFGMRPLGALLGGFVGARFGLEVAICLAASGFAVQATIILASSVPRLASLPEEASAA
jgi:predicted MFS family arabinose efflux permease